MTANQTAKPPENRASLGSMPHFVLAILFIMNLLNYIDRSILNAVLPLIKDEWGISDSALGLLNAAFLVTYMVVAPVFGWLGDRTVRKRIAAAGVAVWSMATALSAFAGNFLQLAGLRAMLGVGEAGYSTVAPTMIADLYPKDARSRMLSIFYVAMPVGYALGYILGGAIGKSHGWRPAFLVVGIPGLLMVLFMLLIREPKRGGSEEATDEELAEYLKTAVPVKSYLEFARIKSYVCNTAAMTMMTFVTGAFAFWGPTYFHRIRGLELDQANYYFGIATLLAGITGTLFGGWIADRLRKRYASAYFLVSGVGVLLSVPAIIGVLMFDSPRIYWVCVFLAEFFLFLNTGPANAVILNITMPNMRAGAFAINIFLIHALGDLFSPYIVGMVSDVTNLKFALVTTLPLVAVGAGIAYLWGMRYLVADTENVSRRMKSALKGTG